MKKASQIGFTLIELMIVVVIVAILMGIAIPSYQHYVRKNVAAQAGLTPLNCDSSLKNGSFLLSRAIKPPCGLDRDRAERSAHALRTR